MPIRSFTCTACGESFERILLTSDAFESATEDTCPECGSVATAIGVELPARRNPQHGIG